MFQDVVTIFNYHKKTDTFYPTVIYGCEVQPVTASTNTKTGPHSEDVVSVHIPYTERYRKPVEWQQNPSQDSFTLNAKNKKDFLCVGEYSKEIIKDDGSVYAEGFYEYMKSNYDDVYLINSVARYKTIPHFEAGGK